MKEPQEIDVQKLIKEYEKYAEEHNFLLNTNEALVTNIVRALLKKEALYGARYCPCRVMTGNKQEDEKITCPCIYHRDEIAQQGHCLCRLFVKK